MANLWFLADLLMPETEIKDKSQIAQVSQMSEAQVFYADSHENSTGTKKRVKETGSSFPNLCLLCSLWFQIRRLG